MVSKQSETFASVKERNYDIRQPQDWISALQKAYLAVKAGSETPIVLLYAGRHYTRLRFTRRSHCSTAKARPTEDSTMEIVDLTKTEHSAPSPDDVHMSDVNSEDIRPSEEHRTVDQPQEIGKNGGGRASSRALP